MAGRSRKSATATCSGSIPTRARSPIWATSSPSSPAPRRPKTSKTSISAWAANCSPASGNWSARRIGARASLRDMTQPDFTLLAVPVFSPLCNLGFALRREVFVVEQQVPEELEHDADDLTATHLVGVMDG